MNLKRFFALFKMDIKKTIREPAALFLIILFPLILTSAFGLAFGSLGAGESTYNIAIINSDGSKPWSQALIGTVSSNQLFNIVDYQNNNQSAQNALVQGQIDAILEIPLNFSESCDSYWNDPMNASNWLNVTVKLYVDSGSMIATQAIPPIIQQILLVTLFGEGAGAVLTPIQLGSPGLVAASKFSQFDYMVPGLFAFAAIFLTMTVSSTLVEDKAKGLLRRIYVSPTTPSEFMLSHGASNIVFAALQTALIFAISALLGFHPAVGWESYAMVFLCVLIFALCNVGFGLIVASIAKNPGTVAGLAMVFIIPQMFLGTFVPVPEAVARFVPSYYVTDATTSLFLRSAPVFSSTILFDLLILSIISILVFLIGIQIFKKYGKK
jgi:ABC-2 type transport system permease protein